MRETFKKKEKSTNLLFSLVNKNPLILAILLTKHQLSFSIIKTYSRGGLKFAVRRFNHRRFIFVVILQCNFDGVNKVHELLILKVEVHYKRVYLDSLSRFHRVCIFSSFPFLVKIIKRMEEMKEIPEIGFIINCYFTFHSVINKHL